MRTLFLAGVSAVAFATSAQGQSQVRTFDVPAQAASSGIPEFAREANIQILISEDDVGGKRTNAVHGDIPVSQALAELLAGTGIAISSNDGHTITLRGPSKNAEAASNDGAANLLAEETVVVTGTNLRGLEYQSSPITTYTKEDIARSGASDFAGLLRIIPQNFSGGSYSVTPDGAFGDGDLRLYNTAGATSPNLRGLGSDSTLVLVNGHRLAPSIQAAVSDVGLIPVSAIDRVDILTDGASAIYGTDAVGGVVNIILRSDYEGVEGSIQGVSDDHADYTQGIFNLSAGTDWGSGSAFLSGSATFQSPLKSNERPFSAGMPSFVEPNGKLLFSELYPDQNQYSVMGSAHQQLLPNVELNLDVVYGHRYSNQTSVSSDAILTDYRSLTINAATSDELSAAASFVVSLPEDWRLQTDFLYGLSLERVPETNIAIIPSEDIANSQLFNAKYLSQIASLDMKLDGDLFQLPAGAVKLAVGGEVRRELYHQTSIYHQTYNGVPQPVFTSSDSNGRYVESGFAEVSVPVVSPAANLPWMQQLSLTAAVRYDNYTKIGDTTNYKVGASWTTFDNLTLRATRSTSFRAPDLGREQRVGAGIFLEDATGVYTNPNGTGPIGVVELDGSSSLIPETSTATTAGADFQPSEIPGLKLSTTWFNYDYINRFGYAPFDQDILLHPAAYGPLITPITSPAQVAALVASVVKAGGTSLLVPPYDNFSYIIDQTFRNLATEKLAGMDLDASYQTTWGDYTIQPVLSATLLFHDNKQILTTLPVIPTLALEGQQPFFRLRASNTVSADWGSITLSANYVGSARNGTLATSAGISDWLTFDAVGQFPLNAVLGNTQLDVAIQNLFDRDPPFVLRNVPFGPNYDPANANPLGRVFSLKLTHRW
jgi:outer membrane receptor protein involved in Fe transport